MLTVGQEEKLQLSFGTSVISACLSTLQWLFVNHRETPGFLFIFFLRGITQVGDYTAACNGNWPDFVSLHANGAAILQQEGWSQSICVESAPHHALQTLLTSLCVILCRKNLGWLLLNFEPKELEFENAIFAYVWLNARVWKEGLCCWPSDFSSSKCSYSVFVVVHVNTL